MVVPALVLGVIAIVLAWLMSRGGLAAHSREPRAGLASSGGSAATPAARRDTALEQLRDLRDALKPAEHTRIERRRAGGAGPYVGPERRRAAAQLLPKQGVRGVPYEGQPTRRRRK